MATKSLAVMVECVSADEFIVWTNGDDPTKSVNDHCALIQQTVRPDWRTGFAAWMKAKGYRYHKDSDYRGGTVADLDDAY